MRPLKSGVISTLDVLIFSPPKIPASQHPTHSAFKSRPPAYQTMKRAAASTKASPKAKRPRGDVPEYHLATSVKDENGNIVWPAPETQIQAARKFIQKWFVFQVPFSFVG